MFVFDESWSKIDPAKAVAAGYTGGFVYCSYDRTGKNGTPPYVQSCLSQGLQMGLVWETFGQAAQGGRGRGDLEAHDFLTQARSLGATGGVLWMVGEDPTREPPANWPGPEAYFAAAKPIINGAGFQLGDYGSEALVNDLKAKGLIDRKWFVGSWSQDIMADLIQQSTTPGASTFGGEVDCNYAPAADWGWTEFGAIAPVPDPVLISMSSPTPAAAPAPPTASVPTTATPPAPALAPAALAVDGIFGADTIRALQAAVGTPADGVYGPNTRIALQRHLGVAADGVVGPITVRALQARVGASQDGIWGPATTRALQAALNGHRF